MREFGTRQSETSVYVDFSLKVVVWMRAAEGGVNITLDGIMSDLP